MEARNKKVKKGKKKKKKEKVEIPAFTKYQAVEKRGVAGKQSKRHEDVIDENRRKNSPILPSHLRQESLNAYN